MSKLDLSGLNSFSGLMKEGAAAAQGVGKPLLLSLDIIDEDPTNKRKNYDPTKLQELADSIAANGVIQPISVKPHPSATGRYQINQGHRRYRASRLAKLATIPAFVASEHNRTTQLVENIQRENLTTAETVAAIAEMLDDMKQTEIAKELGKSKTWVSRYAALTDLPPVLAEVMASERCRDASTLYELQQCWKLDEAEVAAFLEAAGDRQIVQADVEALRASIKRVPQPAPESPADEAASPTPPATAEPEQEPDAAAEVADDHSQQSEAPAPLGQVFTRDREETSDQDTTAAGDAAGGAAGGADDEAERQQNVKPNASPPDPTKVRKPQVQVRVGRREGVLLIARKAEYGLVWVQYEDASDEQVDANKVKLVAVTDGAK